MRHLEYATAEDAFRRYLRAAGYIENGSGQKTYVVKSGMGGDKTYRFPDHAVVFGPNGDHWHTEART